MRSNAAELDALRKLESYNRVQEAKRKNREKIENAFIPQEPDAKPFKEQVDFFTDRSFQKLMRCGNRSAKTFSAMRDFAWKLMRNHPYRPDWNCRKMDIPYTTTEAKVFWILAPTYDFIGETIWGMYLRKFIPEWYYSNDDGTLNIHYHSGKERYLKKIIFRNGDVLEFKSYKQADLSLMGRKIDEAYMDEMPPRTQLMSEVITRTFDNDGSVTFGFTPLVENEEAKEYLDSKVGAGILSLHSWSLTANPLYRDNPKKLARVLAEWSHLPEGERNARLKGDWYYETKHGKVFSRDDLKVVKDFPIPDSWRRACFVDPAAHITGVGLFAQDPESKIWYCYKSVQLGDKRKTYDADTIAEEVIKLDRSENFVYRKYDNAEAWFGAGKVPKRYKFTACLNKNINSAIITCRNEVKARKVIAFESCTVLIKQFFDYEWGPDGKPKNKSKYHALDALMYFCREIPRDNEGALKVEPLKGEHDKVKDFVKNIIDNPIPSPAPRGKKHTVKMGRCTRQLQRRLVR